MRRAYWLIGATILTIGASLITTRFYRPAGNISCNSESGYAIYVGLLPRRAGIDLDFDPPSDLEDITDRAHPSQTPLTYGQIQGDDDTYDPFSFEDPLFLIPPRSRRADPNFTISSPTSPKIQTPSPAFPDPWDRKNHLGVGTSYQEDITPLEEDGNN